jgi:hypothetical protein
MQTAHLLVWVALCGACAESPPGAGQAGSDAGGGSPNSGGAATAGEPTSSAASGASHAGGDSAGGGGGEASAAGDVVWLFDGETGAIQSPASSHDGGEPFNACSPQADAVTVSDQYPAHTGKYSLRVLTRRSWLEDDPDCGTVSTFLTQDTAVKVQEDQEYWHGWAALVPDDVGAHFWSTIWSAEGPENRSLRVNLQNDLSWSWTSQQIGDYQPYDLTLDPDQAMIGASEPETWHEFVASFMLSADDSKGFFKLWHRLQGEAEWQEVVDAHGQSANMTAPYPFRVRHGLHAGHHWHDTDSGQRMIYFDEIRFGDASSGFDSVAPGSGAAAR